MAALVSKEQLRNCADIQVIDTDADFFTVERLKSLQIQSVSIIDVLNCFPNINETVSNNEYRQNFRLWAQNQGKQWWSEIFHHISQTMISEVFDIMLQKPIFLLDNDHQRQYLPRCTDNRLLLYISDDPSFQMWKRQLTLLQYSSESEKDALLKSNHVQPLIEDDMIEIIRRDHLQLAASSLNNDVDLQRIEEVWKDLFYLQSRLHKLEKSTPFVVPIHGTPNLTIIQKAMLPTIFGIDIRRFLRSTTTPPPSVIRSPYYNVHRHQLIDILQWEYFLLEMGCQRPLIYLSQNCSNIKLPPLPSLTMFTDEECALLGTKILSAQEESTKECLRQFPIEVDSQMIEQTGPVSEIFDEIIVRDLPSLPRITVPPHCRPLAIALGVCVEYNLYACVTILKLLSNEKNTNIDLYIQWLGHLQLYARQQHNDFDRDSLLLSCQLYLPDQQNFYSLKDLLVTSENKDHPNIISYVSKYLNLQWISPSANQIYWQFKELFRLLGCTCAITIDHVYETIYRANHDKANFFSLGDCTTILTEMGMETMIILFQHLEELIWQCVKQNIENHDLYRVVVENKPSTALCGSREDLQWRFDLSSSSISEQLIRLTEIKSQEKKIGLPTIDRRIVTKTSENIVYACLELIVAQNLAKDLGKRDFISPSITRTCPLVIATFGIDYVERRGKLEWEHTNNNMECQLTQLSNIFRKTINDSELEVIIAKYARVNLLLSDSFVIDSINEQDRKKIDQYMILTEFPFWIFNKTILLCADYDTSYATRAVIAISALTTLLNKRNSIPFDEAKAIAQQKISTCNEFRSNRTAHFAGAVSTIYSYADVLFPVDHRAVESIIIPIGNYITTEQDVQDDAAAVEFISDPVAQNRIAEDRVYRNRVQTEDHTSRKTKIAKDWTDPSVVDAEKEILIGHNAEHYFFTYLQRHYGPVDVTPTKNWRSTSRLVTYPQYRRNIDNTLGFDFELHDTREVFTRSSKSTTKQCYFEVKGTSGIYNEEHTRFNVSQNEFKVCQDIANDETKRQCSSYFIVLIENCLQPEKIALGTMIEW